MNSREEFQREAHEKFPKVHPSNLAWIWDYRRLPWSAEVDMVGPGLRSYLQDMGGADMTVLVWMPPWDQLDSDVYWVTPISIKLMYA